MSTTPRAGPFDTALKHWPIITAVFALTVFGVRADARSSDLDRRLTPVEQEQRAVSDRLTRIEERQIADREILKRIERKLDQ